MQRRSILRNRSNFTDVNDSTDNRLKDLTHDSFLPVDEFLKNASIHGLKYIGQRNRSVLERFCWLLLVMTGCGLSSYVCYYQWQLWDDSPILISMNSDISIHKPMIFPDVTICSTSKVSKERLDALLQEPKFQNINQTFMYKCLHFFMKWSTVMKESQEFRQIQASLKEYNLDSEDLSSILHRVTPSCSDLILDCIWKTDAVPCDWLFSLKMTDSGPCCSFTPEGKDRFLPNHYSPNGDKISTGEDAVVDDYGVNYALRIILKHDSIMNGDSLFNNKFNGFKVLLHKNKELPDVEKRGFVIDTGKEIYMAIKRFSVNYTKEITQIPIEKRQCYMEGERKLKHQDIYSVSGCLLECRAEKIIKECGCLPHYSNTDPSIPGCNLEAYHCAARTLASIGEIHRKMSACGCLATCADCWFDTELSMAPLSPTISETSATIKRLIKALRVNANESSKLTDLKIFFKYESGMSFKMNVRFSKLNMIAWIGGLLGIGFGFSLISAVEVLYFLGCGSFSRLLRRYNGRHNNISEPCRLKKRSVVPVTNNKVTVSVIHPLDLQ